MWTLSPPHIGVSYEGPGSDCALSDSRNSAHIASRYVTDNVGQETCAMVTAVSTPKYVFSQTCVIYIAGTSFIIHSLLAFFFFCYCFPLHISAFDPNKNSYTKA